MKKIIPFLFLIVFCDSCFQGSCAVEKPATMFANLLHDGKLEEAKEQSTDRGASFLDSCIRNSIPLNITHVYDIRCRVKDRSAVCEFCCSNDSIKRTFSMIKVKDGGGWCNVCGTWAADDLSGLIKK